MDEEFSGACIPDPEMSVGPGAREAFAVGTEVEAGDTRLRVSDSRRRGPEREPDRPVSRSQSRRATPLHRSEVRPSGLKATWLTSRSMTTERQSLSWASPFRIVPLPPAEVRFALARLHQIEQEPEPDHVVGFRGAEAQVRAGRVQSSAAVSRERLTAAPAASELASGTTSSPPAVRASRGQPPRASAFGHGWPRRESGRRG